MIKISFDNFIVALSRGFIESEDVVDFDEMYLDPVRSIKNPVFLTDFKYLAYNHPVFPIPLNHLKPFIKFQKSKTSKTEKTCLPNVGRYFDKEQWESVWKHLIFDYLYQTYGLAADPWGAIDSKELSTISDSIYNYYEDLTRNHLGSDKGFENFINNIILPEEYTQAALINSEISQLLNQIVDQTANSKKSPFVNYLKEKGAKWASYIEKFGLSKFWKGVIEKSNETKKPIEYSAVVLYCYLLSIETYLKRMDVDTSIAMYTEFITNAVSKGIIPKEYHVEFLLSHFISKLFNTEELVKRIQFFPDYLLLNYLSQSYYTEFFEFKHSRRTNKVDIYKKLRTNLSKIDYLSIIGKPIKNGSLTFQINSQLINQINYLPPYKYRSVLKDLLLINLELYGFSVNRLGIQPEDLFKEFEQFKSAQQYNLSTRLSFEDWLNQKAKKLIESRTK